MTDTTEPPVDPNAVAAGWNPDDGPAPEEHGTFVEPLAASQDLSEVIGEQTPEVQS